MQSVEQEICDVKGGASTFGIAVLALVASLFVLCPLAAKAAVPEPSFFRSLEIQHQGLEPFPKWTGAMVRYFKEKGKGPANCRARNFNRCHEQNWRALIESLRTKKPREQIEAVNRFMNKSPYIVDPINWGVKDYWESPGQFFSRNGDCEDYAIAKYLTLRRLGFPISSMRIVVLQDQNLKIPHAVLIVKWEGQTLVLDNQIRRVVQSQRIRHYQPVYSINEESWWMHIPAR